MCQNGTSSVGLFPEKQVRETHGSSLQAGQLAGSPEQSAASQSAPAASSSLTRLSFNTLAPLPYDILLCRRPPRRPVVGESSESVGVDEMGVVGQMGARLVELDGRANLNGTESPGTLSVPVAFVEEDEEGRMPTSRHGQYPVPSGSHNPHLPPGTPSSRSGSTSISSRGDGRGRGMPRDMPAAARSMSLVERPRAGTGTGTGEPDPVRRRFALPLVRGSKVPVPWWGWGLTNEGERLLLVVG